MELAALILSTISLIFTLILFIWFLAKNVFSTHQIQMVPVDPMKKFEESFGEMGKPIADQFRDLGDPLDQEEMESIQLLREKRKKVSHEHSNLT